LLKNQSKISNKSRLAVFLVFITNGVLMATWVSRIPVVQSKFGLGDGQLGLVLAGLSAGLLASLFISGSLIDRFGSFRIVLFSSLISCFALPCLMLVPHPILLFVFLFIFGAGISAADVAMNEQAVLVERNIGKPLMSSFHGGYSAGTLSGALIGASMASFKELSPLIHFLLISTLFGAIIILVFPYLIPVVSKREKKNDIFRFPERGILFLGAIAFCCSIGEETVTDWGAIYLTQVLNTSAAFAVLGYAAFTLMMTSMRLIGDFLSRKYSPALIIRAGGFIAASGILIAAITNNRYIVIVGFAIVGIGVANIVPLLFSTAGNLSGISPGTGIAGVATISFLGFLVGPPLIGYVADMASSLRVSFLLSALLVGSIILSGKAILNKRISE